MQAMPTADVEQRFVKLKIVDGLARIVDEETEYPAEDARGRELDHGGEPESRALVVEAQCRRFNIIAQQRRDAMRHSPPCNEVQKPADTADKTADGIADNPRKKKRKTLPTDPLVLGAANYIKSTKNRPGSRIEKVREYLRTQGKNVQQAERIDKQLQRYKEDLKLP